MYSLTEIETEGLHYLELVSTNGESRAQICLNQGGRLSALIFENIQILADYHPSTYKDNFASAILFPFANRIKNGEYVFNKTNYKLNCNEATKNNALHGLVYDKTFEYADSILNSNFGAVTLRYNENENPIGFPFKFNIELTYKLSESGIRLSVNVLNTDNKGFPFTLGWHPYFKTRDLYNSHLNFNSSISYLVDDHQIPNGEVSFNETMPFQLKDTNLDTGYKLVDNQVEFLTPEYQLKIEATSVNNYLQVYTPPDSNILAIEPMTGAADSFNNKMGLQILNPKDNYTIQWTLTIESETTNTTNHLNK